MPSRRCDAERQNLNGVEADESDITERSGETIRKEELFGRTGRHRGGRIEQHADGDAGLDLEHLQEHFVEPHVGAPVDGAQIVAVVKVAMVEKFLATAGETRSVMAADKTGEGLLPVDGQAFQAFEKFPVQQRFARHNSPSKKLCGAGLHGYAGNDGREDGIGRLAVGVGVEIQNDAVTENGRALVRGGRRR